jgi:hypothetical protein
MKDEDKKALIDYLNENKDDLAKFFKKTRKDIEDFITSLEAELVKKKH